MPTITFLGLGPDSPRPAEAEAAGWVTDTIPGPLDSAAQAQAWRALSRSPGQAVWIAWSGLTPPDLASLRRFRVSAPTTRILVEVPADLTPPNNELAQVVGMGITDLVRPGMSFAEAVARTATYADVAAWQGQVRSFADPDPVQIIEREKIVERERVVEKRVATTARPALVAVYGAAPGAGATTLAVAVAERLAAYGPTAILDHLPTVAHPTAIADEPTGLAVLTAGRLVPDLTVECARYDPEAADPVRVPDWRDAMTAHRHAYVVVDAGVVADRPDAAELMRTADLNFVVVPGASRLLGCAAWLDPAIQRERRCVTVAWAPEAKMIQALMPTAEFAVVSRLAEAQTEAIDAMLAPILPDAPPRKRRWGRPRSRRPRPTRSIPRSEPPTALPSPSTSESAAAPMGPAITVNVGGGGRFRPARLVGDLVWWAVLIILVGLLVWALGLFLAHEGGGGALSLVVERAAHWEARVVGAVLAGRKGG